MKRYGFTLIEVMISVAILTVVGGILFVLSLSMAQSSQVQEARITSVDDARGAMFIVIRELRQASMASINWNDLPGEQIEYRVAQDISGNGVAVDSSVRLELSDIRMIQRDSDDQSDDGVTDTQLVLVDGNNVRVLANGLLPGEGGVWFERADEGGVRVQIATERRGPGGTPIRAVLTETVVPRN